MTLKVAVLSLGWPPCWGGGEIYAHRVVETLTKEGFDATGITATPELEGWNNGTAPVVRLCTLTEKWSDPRHYIHLLADTSESGFDTRQTWLNDAFRYLQEQHFDVVIVQNQGLDLGSWDSLEKYSDLPVVTLAYDFDHGFIQKLNTLKDQYENSEWLTIDALHGELVSWLKSAEKPESKSLLSQHSFSQEKGRLHITDFNEHLVSKITENEAPSFVLHPPLEDQWWVDIPPEVKVRNNEEQLTIGMVNPSLFKGRQVLMSLIKDRPQHKYRILLGGHRKLRADFEADLESRGIDPQSLEIIEFEPDIRDFFDSLDLFLVPSQYEGYGQVAAEALARKVPVLTHDINNIREATMGLAKYVKTSHYFNSNHWSMFVDLIDANYSRYAEQAAEASKLLKTRQEQESKAFRDFILGLKDEG